MKREHKIVKTSWPYGSNEKPESVCLSPTFDSVEEAMEEIEKYAEIALKVLNGLNTNSPREKVAIEDSDGNIIGYDYPFRADFDGDNDCVIRFWDGDDYQNIMIYNVVPR